MTNEELWMKIERGLINLTPNCQLEFGVQIVEHCNLNCTQCNHFSPLAEEEYLDISSYKKDCDQLSKLFDGEAGVGLTGGEPLLHPHITEFMRITREAFPRAIITLTTNGLLFPTMPEDFWEACKKYDVIIEPTCYPDPVKVDYAGFKKIAESKGVKYNPLNYDHKVQSKVYPIKSRASETREGFSDVLKRNFLNCQVAHCTMLKNGKMYPCTQAVNAPHLKKFFNLDMPLSERDGIDIYSVNSGSELLERLSRPIPFCRYCDVTTKPITCDWGLSRKDRYEWLAFEFSEDDVRYLKEKKPVVYVFGAGSWGTLTVNWLKDQGIAIKSVLATREKKGVNNVLDVPIVTLDELGEVEPNSICIVTLRSLLSKSDVYPLLSQIGFGDVVPISGVNNLY